jgi:DHA2 family multidrug resistance protein-like MFS transporter
MDGLPPERRRWAVLTTSIAAAMSNIDLSMVNIALPTIARELHITAAESVWIVNGYQFAITIALIPVAAVADIVGYLTVYRIGLAIVALASLAAAGSRSLLPLIVARAVQGVGNISMATSSDALQRLIFPRSMLGRATGINAMAVAIGVLSGPVIGGAILSVAPWPALFWLYVPVALAVLAASFRVFPPTPGAGHAFDARSAVLGAVTFAALVAALGGGGHGEAPLLVALEFALFAVLGWIFVRRQRTLPVSMYAVELFARPVFRLSVIASVVSFVAQTLAYIALPFLFQSIFERSVLASGLLMVPWLIGTAVMSPIAGHLSDRYDASLLGGVGLLGFAGGLALLALMPAHAATLDIIWRMAVCGTFYGFFQSPNNRAILSATPRERAAAASAIKQSARIVGQTTGASLAALIFTFNASALMNGAPTRAAVTICLGLAATLAALAALASAARHRGMGEAVSAAS